MRIAVRSWWLLAAALFALYPTVRLSAQQQTARVTGQVVDQDGAPLAGVQIVIIHQGTGTQTGGITGENGRFLVLGVRAGGPYRIEARMIGYGLEVMEDVTLEAGETFEADFRIGAEAISIDAIEIFATRAVERKTPVPYSDVDQVKIRRQLGSRDLPLVLNVTPSVYATGQGGGAGEARMNVRGFNQRNVAIMINGVPVNDMENGWVYWSNWDGIGDATASIQLQRGLSAVNLATPSIGGTMNVITDPAGMRRGFNLKQEFGNDGFWKTTLVGSTGLMNNKLALMGAGVRKVADGTIDGTWTDAWAYYFAGSYQVNDNHRLELFAIGAPQRHGQSYYKQNIGAFDADFARDLDSYDPAALDDYPESSRGRYFNQNYNTVSSSYSGKQAVGDDTFSRYDAGFLNERENFYHKPQVNLNWYASLRDDVSLTTVAYYSGGKGGGTGTLGDMEWDYDSQPTRIVDWDATIAENQANADGSLGILRNSRNNQWTIGAISKLRWEYSQPTTFEVGLDWRTAEIDHYREVRDLLGGAYYRDDSSDFWSVAQEERGLGDKLDYHFTNTVDWLGAYAQGEYSTLDYSFFGMAGVSTIEYTYVNHFAYDATTQDKVRAETGNVWGWQIKGGALYNATEQFSLFANAGYVSKVPIFDGMIDDYAGAKNPDPQNEKFISAEAGVTFTSTDRSLAARVNGYYTKWDDRTQTIGITTEDGLDALYNLTGMGQTHIGLEAEVAYQPIDILRLDLGASIANWEYTTDVSGSYRPDPGEPLEPFDYYVDGLKVGDAPQTQLYYVANLYPYEGLFLAAVGKTYARHFADFDPWDRDDPADRRQAWEAPGYTKFDLHVGYDLPAGLVPGDVQLFANVFNIFDAVYVQDAVDNSRYNGFDGDHDADDAEVYLGLPRSFNFGLRVTY